MTEESEHIFQAEANFQLEQAELDAKEDRFLNRAAIVAIGMLAMVGAVVWGIDELNALGSDVNVSTEWKVITGQLVGVLVGRFTVLRG